MFTKILLLASVVAAVCAVKVHEHSHGHASTILIHKHEEHKKQTVQQHKHHVVPHKKQVVHQKAHQGHHEKHDVDYYAEPKYEYEYQIKDPHTHDFKSQHEHRDGDVVKGEYSLHQPDGTIRIVKYHADKKSGFQADVKYQGHAQHIVPEHRHHHH